MPEGLAIACRRQINVILNNNEYETKQIVRGGRSMKGITIVLVGLIGCFSMVPGLEAYVELVTIPSRDSVQVTIYNTEDLTLVKEERFLTFKKVRRHLALRSEQCCHA